MPAGATRSAAAVGSQGGSRSSRTQLRRSTVRRCAARRQARGDVEHELDMSDPLACTWSAVRGYPEPHLQNAGHASRPPGSKTLRRRRCWVRRITECGEPGLNMLAVISLVSTFLADSGCWLTVLAAALLPQPQPRAGATLSAARERCITPSCECICRLRSVSAGPPCCRRGVWGLSRPARHQLE